MTAYNLPAISTTLQQKFWTIWMLDISLPQSSEQTLPLHRRCCCWWWWWTHCHDDSLSGWSRCNHCCQESVTHHKASCESVSCVVLSATPEHRRRHLDTTRHNMQQHIHAPQHTTWITTSMEQIFIDPIHFLSFRQQRQSTWVNSISAADTQTQVKQQWLPCRTWDCEYVVIILRQKRLSVLQPCK